MLEWFLGTKEERQADATIGRLSRKKTAPTEKEQAMLVEARILSRRLFTKRLAGGIAGISVVGSVSTALWKLYENEQKATEQALDRTLKYYMEGFRSLSVGDIEAEKIYEFVQRKSKKATIAGRQILAGEDGSVDDIYIGVVDPKLHPRAYSEMPGFAYFKYDRIPTYLLFKNVPITQVWAGAVAGHESLHAYQWLNRVEQQRENGFLLGEVDAYDLEFRLLDQFTKGEFSKALREQATAIRKDGYRGRLSSEDESRFNSLFPKPLSQEEGLSLRGAAFLVAINFAAVDLRASNPAEALTEKANYIKSVFDGSIPMLP